MGTDVLDHFCGPGNVMAGTVHDSGGYNNGVYQEKGLLSLT